MTSSRLDRINAFRYWEHFHLTAHRISSRKCNLPWVIAPSSMGRDLTESVIKKKKSRERIGSYWLNTLWYIHQYCWNHVSKATDSLAVLFLARQIAPLLLNSSVNAVREGDKKWSDPHMEWVEVISITLAFISAGWLKMIRVPELKLILRDWLSVTRVWHNQCKWSHSPALSNPAPLRGRSLIKGYLSLFKICIIAVWKTLHRVSWQVFCTVLFNAHF